MSIELQFFIDPAKGLHKFSQDIIRAWKIPLHPPEIIFGSPITKKEWEVSFAQNYFGIFAVKSVFLEEFLWQKFNQALKNHPELTKQFPFESAWLKSSTLEKLLVYEIEKIVTISPDPLFQALLNYVGNPNESAGAKKIFSLASQLSLLFLEYENHRPHFNQYWPDKPYFSKHGQELETEGWQRALWERVMGEKGSLRTMESKTQQKWWSLAQLFDVLKQHHVSITLDQPLFLFGTSEISLFHRLAIDWIAKSNTCALYLWRPTPHYWADLDKGFEEFEKYPAAEYLAKWGASQRENQTLWEEFTQFNSTIIDEDILSNDEDTRDKALPKSDKFSIHQKNSPLNNPQSTPSTEPNLGLFSLLKSTQQSFIQFEHQEFLRFKRSTEQRSLVSDLQVWPCNSRSEEVNLVYQDILQKMSTHKNLSAEDFTIWVSDVTNYLELLELQFQYTLPHSQQSLPYQFIGINQETADLNRAMHTFLQIIHGSLSLDLVFSLLRNSFVQNSLKLSPFQIEIWLNWMDELGVVQFFDPQDKINKDYPNSKTNTYSLAHEILLRQLLEPPMNLESSSNIMQQNSWEHWDSPIQYIEENLETWLTLIHTLNQYRQTLKPLPEEKWETYLGRWTACWKEFLHAHTHPTSTKWLIKWEQETLEWNALHRNQKIPSSTFCREALESLIMKCSGTFQSPVGTGVRIGTVGCTRNTPHQYLYLLGLNENFPQGNQNSTLDLRQIAPLPGDSSPKKRDLNAFLESIITTQEQWIVTYLYIDPISGEKLPPSSVLEELKTLIQKNHPEITEQEISSLLDCRAKQVHLDESSIPSTQSLGNAQLEKNKVKSQNHVSNHGELLKGLSNRDLETFLKDPLTYHLQTKKIHYDEETEDTSLNPMESLSLSKSDLKKFIRPLAHLCLREHFPGGREQDSTRQSIFLHTFNTLDGLCGNRQQEKLQYIYQGLQACLLTMKQDLGEGVFESHYSLATLVWPDPSKTGQHIPIKNRARSIWVSKPQDLKYFVTLQMGNSHNNLGSLLNYLLDQLAGESSVWTQEPPSKIILKFDEKKERWDYTIGPFLPDKPNIQDIQRFLTTVLHHLQMGPRHLSLPLDVLQEYFELKEKPQSVEEIAEWAKENKISKFWGGFTPEIYTSLLPELDIKNLPYLSEEYKILYTEGTSP